MIKERSIAEILHDAADIYLWDGVGNYEYCSFNKNKYSCVAALVSEFGVSAYGNSLVRLSFSHVCRRRSKVIPFLKSLGVCYTTTYQFSKFNNHEEQQAARYLWLKFAALYAEELGI